MISLFNSWYASIFSFSFNFCIKEARYVYQQTRLITVIFKDNIWSIMLQSIICMGKYHNNLNSYVTITLSILWLYHLSPWSNPSFWHNFQWTIWTTLSCLQLPCQILLLLSLLLLLCLLIWLCATEAFWIGFGLFMTI